MDLSHHITWNLQLLTGILNIIFINLVLSGDNAVLIAMAVRGLPRTQRVKGIAFGAGAAVILRIILTFFVAQILRIAFVKFLGGAVILWLAVKLFVEGGGDAGVQKEAGNMMQAVRIIVIADLTMSIDNVLAVAAASQGNPFLLLFGLALSIPFVLFTSNLLSILMDKHPIIIFIGAAILGRVGGDMMITDPFIEKLAHPGKMLQYGIQIIAAAGVIALGRLWLKWKLSAHEKASDTQEN